MIFLLPVLAFAQKTDSLVKKDFRPQAIRLGTDLISLARGPIDDSFTGWEANADVGFYRYYLTFDIGHWERNFTTETEQYNNSGSYWRVGVDVNFLKKDPEKNNLLLGARYARGVFDEHLSFGLDDIWNSGTTSYSNINTTASWAELTAGLRIKLWKTIWLGYTTRYKFALNTNETSNMVPHDVPGFGKTNKKATWGFNYQLLFRIPFKREEINKTK